MEFQNKILESINNLLKSEGLIKLTLEEVYFINDDDVNYQSNTIQKNKIYNSQQSVTLFNSLLNGGPSWIHGNLMITDKKNHFVSLKIGQKIGNPKPTINVSIELNKTFKIV